MIAHKHLRRRIERWIATGGVAPPEVSAGEPPLCASEASFQVLSQGEPPPRAESAALLGSPRAESVATSASRRGAIRRKVRALSRVIHRLGHVTVTWNMACAGML